MGFSLRFKIIFLTVIILIFAVGATTLASSYVFSQEYSDVLQSRVLIIGQGLKAQLDRLLELGIPLEELVGFEKQLQDTIKTYEDIAYIMIVDPDGKILFHNDPSQHNENLTDIMTLKAVKSRQEVIQIYSDQKGQFYDVFIPILNRDGNHVGVIRIGFPVELVTQKTDRLLIFSGAIAALFLIIAVVLLVFTLSVLVTNPLMKLLTVIEQIRSGGVSLATRVEIDSKDEIGQVGSAFNTMATQLHDLINTLEEQVVARTRQLEAVMEITQQLTGILDLNDLLHQIVVLTKETFNYYHVHIYLFDKGTNSLQLAEGYGQAGAKMKTQGHIIAADAEQSLVAQVAREGQVNIIDDVRANPNRLPNPLLPDTRSEIAVPIMLGNEVVSVLHVQSDKVGGLTRDDEIALRALANQAAVALTNARLFEQTTQAKEVAEQAREEAEAANYTLEMQIWQTTGQAELSDKMRGEQDLPTLANSIIQQLCHYLQVQIGALYLVEGDHLKLAGRYAFSSKNGAEHFKFGEGLVGQIALEKQAMVVNEVPPDYIRVRSGLGETMPRNLMLFPLIYEDRVMGVVELGTLTEFSQSQQEFIETALDNIAIAFNTAQARARIDELLMQTQRQAEELQAQGEELRVANEELETQTESLRASEARLREQRTELEATNTQLEEKAAALEESSQTLRQKQAILDRQNQELKMAQEALEQKAEELALASKYKSEFLANMSHELRTPLNSLLILARMLADNEEGNLTQEQVESAQIIYSGGTDLLTLINDILDLAKVESGKLTFTFEAMPLSDLTAMAQAHFTHLAEEKGLDLNLTLAEDLPDTIETDPQRVKQIVKNLLSNAFKFTSQGSVTLQIERPQAQGDLSQKGLDPSQTIAISVADTGIGMTPEQLKIIFEAFQQAESGTSRRYGGTGLGLSISRELATKLGGHIEVTSQPEQGSRFTLYLPINGQVSQGEVEPEGQPQALQKQEVQGPQSVSSQTAGPIAPSSSLPDDRTDLVPGDKILLIIEDDPDFAKIVHDFSHKKGFKGLIALNGKSGLELVKTYQPDAIILDLNLPDISGLEVLGHLKNDPLTRHIPVHVISAEEEDLEVYRKGAMGYLTKPVSQEALAESFQKIERFIAREIKTLLLVEDDPKARHSIKKLLEGGDVHITEAERGQTALEMLKIQQFDCMILDLSLPDMSGFEVLNTINGHKAKARCPVIVYTGHDLTAEENLELMKYADSVIVKGVKSPERLLDETALFLHRIVADMPKDKQRTIKQLYDQEAQLKDKKILIVDDDMRNSFALSKLLSDKGLIVKIAQNGQKALDLLAKEPVDLILMDIMMPVMDGYETIRRIRTQPEFKTLPILALTAKAMTGDREKCLAAGANDYLSKPIDVDRLFSMLRVWLYH